MENKEIWPCMFAGDCAHACHPGIVISVAPECYMTTDPGLRVRGECACKVLDDGTIVIAYPTYGAEKSMLYEIAALLAQEKTITFRQIHYICTHQQPGPASSRWPLIWNGCVEIDDERLTFEFIERKDTDDKV